MYGVHRVRKIKHNENEIINDFDNVFEDINSSKDDIIKVIKKYVPMVREALEEIEPLYRNQKETAKKRLMQDSSHRLVYSNRRLALNFLYLY